MFCFTNISAEKINYFKRDNKSSRNLLAAVIISISILIQTLVEFRPWLGTL